MGHPGALSPPPAARGAYELRNSGRLKACKRCEQRRCSNARINSRRSRMNGHVGENGLEQLWPHAYDLVEFQHGLKPALLRSIGASGNRDVSDPGCSGRAWP
jgi:hypothetical protein